MLRTLVRLGVDLNRQRPFSSPMLARNQDWAIAIRNPADRALNLAFNRGKWFHSDKWFRWRFAIWRVAMSGMEGPKFTPFL